MDRILILLAALALVGALVAAWWRVGRGWDDEGEWRDEDEEAAGGVGGW